MKKINWQYTIGEILIVIVGITIAFSINKCSDNSKNKADKLQYLTNIRNDIEADKEQLENNLTTIEEKINTTRAITPLLGTDSQEKTTIVGKLFSIASITNFVPKDITYQTLINSGDFKLIDNFELKKNIEEHYSSYNTLLKDYQRQETIHKEYLGPYFINHADYDAMRKGQLGLENERLLKNILQSMNGSFMLKQKATETGIKSCDSVIKILNTYIK